MIRRIENERTDEAEALWYLQRLAYAVEAERIGYGRIPPLIETVADLKRCGETLYGSFEDGELCGAIGYAREGAEVTICRLMVHPDSFRRGIAGSLLAFAEDAEPDADRFRVSTGIRNEPAVRLYEKHGYRRIGHRKVYPDLVLVDFLKDMA